MCSQFLVIIMCNQEWFYGLGIEDYAMIKPFKFVVVYSTILQLAEASKIVTPGE